MTTWCYGPLALTLTTSGGLAIGGRPAGGCRGSSGQLYVRSTTYKGRYAIMYAWYMPKDQGTSGLALIGHRHDWEDIVVWVDNATAANPSMIGISASAHGKYHKYSTPPSDLFQPGTNRPYIKYYQDVSFFGTHSVNTDNALGGEQPMIQYEMLPTVARNALDSYDFGDANFPLRDGRFENQLEKAWPW